MKLQWVDRFIAGMIVLLFVMFLGWGLSMWIEGFHLWQENEARYTQDKT